MMYKVVECEQDTDELQKALNVAAMEDLHLILALPFREHWDDVVQGRELNGYDSKYRLIFQKGI